MLEHKLPVCNHEVREILWQKLILVKRRDQKKFSIIGFECTAWPMRHSWFQKESVSIFPTSERKRKWVWKTLRVQSVQHYLFRVKKIFTANAARKGFVRETEKFRTSLVHSNQNINTDIRISKHEEFLLKHYKIKWINWKYSNFLVALEACTLL